MPVSPRAVRSGFTLLELLLVVTITALVTATAAIRWSTVAHNASAAAAVTRLEAVDAHLRQYVRSRRRPALLAIDRAEGRLQKRYLGDKKSASPWESLGAGLQLEEIRVAGAKGRQSVIEIPFATTGVSPTYGLHLVGPGERESWLIVAGGSGQFTPLESESQWDAALDLVDP
ncbi:MAG: prepilin-type N-terminal cleavage/methylation domain-containing protein [Planctomycetales bacterium]|nr:prepilin-type N-terminal cleavage/methylation domain-containing protein [Planctomycetales bacterium]